MNETRIALAFVTLGVALLVGTFAYLAHDRDDGASAGASGAESPRSAVPGAQEQHRSGARTEAKGPAAGAPRRSGPAEQEKPAPLEGAPPPSGGAPAPSEPSSPMNNEPSASAVEGVVPAYAPLRESEADGVTEVVVGTEETGEAGMRLVASDLASDYPGDGVLLVEFREGANGDASAGRETGFALVFGSREAALAPDLEYTPEEVDEIFEEDGGVRAVSYDDLGEETPALKDDFDRIRVS